MFTKVTHANVIVWHFFFWILLRFVPFPSVFFKFVRFPNICSSVCPSSVSVLLLSSGGYPFIRTYTVRPSIRPSVRPFVRPSVCSLFFHSPSVYVLNSAVLNTFHPFFGSTHRPFPPVHPLPSPPPVPSPPPSSLTPCEFNPLANRNLPQPSLPLNPPLSPGYILLGGGKKTHGCFFLQTISDEGESKGENS